MENNNKIKHKIEALAKELMFDLSDDEIQNIVNEYDALEKALSSLKDLNLDQVEPTSFIQPLTYLSLNNDEYIEYNQELVFKNSKYYKDGMVVINDKK